ILRRAFKVANDPPAGPVFVALPINVMEQETTIGPSRPDRLWRAGVPDPAAIAEIARRLRQSRNPVIVCGDDIAHAGATAELVRLAESIGAPVWNEGLHH